MNFGLTLEIVREMALATLRHGIGGTNRGIPDALKSVTLPYPSNVADEMERLRTQKEEAIARLDFEKAAAFRDQIEQIKKAVLLAKTDELKQKIEPRMRDVRNPEKTESNIPSKPQSLFSRFTDRARKVMQLANQEAQRFNHEYIGTEHLLLGLIKEGSGIAASVLKNLDIDLRKIRLEVERIIQSGPYVAPMVKLAQTPRAKKVIEYSMEEARNLNHNYVGTEHILLGLLREKEAVAAQVLMNLGLNLENVRAEVLAILGHGISALNREISDSTKILEILGMLFPPEILREIDRLQTEKAAAVESKDFEKAATLRNRIVDLIEKNTDRNWKDKIGPHKLEIESLLRRIQNSETPASRPAPDPNDPQSRLTKRARLVMRRANREAVLRGAEYVGSEHVLLALIDLASGITRKVFKNFDVDRQKIHTEIERHIQRGPKTAAFRNLPQTPRVKQVIQYSVEEAQNTTGDLVDSEHILLGLLRADESVAARVLFSLGLTLKRARQEVLKLSRE
jgi:ATP-dependent Clp protease ATP-binding subunit ClpA